MNTVGPYHNRQETYKYFSLPFCVGSKKSISHYHETLGEALQGVELEFSGLDIKFKGKWFKVHLVILKNTQTLQAWSFNVKNWNFLAPSNWVYFVSLIGIPCKVTTTGFWIYSEVSICVPLKEYSSSRYCFWSDWYNFTK